MRAVLLMSIALLSSGCATVTRGSKEVLVVETEPPGAAVDIAPIDHRCTSPCSVSLKRKGTYTIDIKKDGFEPVRINVLSQVAGAGAAGMAGNVLLGGIIGAAVDAGTGATKELKPNPVKVNMVAIPTVAPAPTIAPLPSSAEQHSEVVETTAPHEPSAPSTEIL